MFKDKQMTVATSLFWIFLFGAVYSYFLYPLLLILMPKRRRVEAISETMPPSISPPKLSFVITAFNEENGIRAKIENTLTVNYPPELLEIIVASDGSTDSTNDIVLEYAAQGVRLAKVDEQKGKENAQRFAIDQAKGDIIVFSDVSTRIEPQSLHIIANAFLDPEVGAVSSEDRFITSNGEVAGEGAYVKYEMWLRKLESSVCSLVGLSGSFFAARKEICADWDITVPSDFNTALSCVLNDKAAVTVPNLLGFYPNLADESKEYQRKLRTVIRGIAALFNRIEVANPFRFGFFAVQVISHKVMRWLVPWFLAGLMLTNLILLGQGFIYQLIFIGQLAFYTVATLGWVSQKLRLNSLIKIPFFFTQVNIAIAHATLQYLGGKRVTHWKPSKR